MSHSPTEFLDRVRRWGFAEGLSFLLLVFVGMPVKYLLGEPMLVRVFGPLHGALFLWLCILLLRAVTMEDWPVRRAAVVFLASLLPFGPLLIDGWLRRQASTAREVAAD